MCAKWAIWIAVGLALGGCDPRDDARRTRQRADEARQRADDLRDAADAERARGEAAAEQARADAEKAKLEINPVDGDKVQALVKEIYATPADVAKQAAAALK